MAKDSGKNQVEKFNAVAVDAALERYDIIPADKLGGAPLDLAGKVKALQAHFAEEFQADDLVDCGTCGLSSDPALEACPFCGVGDDEPGPAAHGVEAEEADPQDEPASEPDPDPNPDPIEDGEEVPEVEATDPPTVDDTKMAPALAAVVETLEGQTLVRKPRKKAEKAVKESKKEPAKKDALAVTKAAPMQSADVAKLDKAVEEVKRLDQQMNGYNWQLFCKLKEISESQIWKLRVSEGKVAYRTFEEFANTELDISREYAQLCVRIAGRFSEKEVLKFGPTKLRSVLNAGSDSKQAEALKMLEEGASRRDVERKMKTTTKARDLVSRGTRAKPSKTKAPKGGTTSITVAAIEGKQKIKLWKKPDASKDKIRAKKLSDAPWGEIVLANDVRMWVTVMADNKGELVLLVDTRRESPVE